MAARIRGRTTAGRQWRRRDVAVAVLFLMHGYALATGLAPQPRDLMALSLESLMTVEVQSASRFTQTISEAPSAASVITADEIKTFGWRTLGDILNSLPGIYANNDRTYTYLGARGHLRPGDLNPRFLLMIDGHRINDPLYDQAMMGQEFMLDVDLIDRVEYVPGPGSAVYGSNAFFGVVNVITKRGRDISGLQVSGQAGSGGMRQVRATLGGKGESGVEWLISASKYHRDGKDLFFAEYNTPDQNNGIARGLDYERTESVFAKASAGPFSLAFAHSERNKGTPTASYWQDFNDPRSRVRDTATYLNLGYDQRLSPHTEVSARLHYSQNRYAGQYVYFDEDLGRSRVDYDRGHSEWWGGNLKLVSTALSGHKFVTGIEYQKNARIKQLNYGLDPVYAENLNLKNSNSRTGLYVQDEWALRPDLLLSVGLRADHNTKTQDKNAFNPRLGLIFKLAPTTTAKILYGKAYRLPNFYELYYDDRDTQVANPHLRPERIQTGELVLEHQWGPGSRLRLSAYRNKVKDMISTVPVDSPNPGNTDGATQFQNVQSATAVGVEAEWQQVWRNGTRLRSSLSWQKATDDATGDTLANAPRWLGKVNLSTPISPLWRAGVEAQYVAPRKTLASRLGGHTLANLTLFSDRLYQGVEVSASVYNLFNRRYAEPASADYLQDALAQDGRTFRLKVDYKF